MIKKLYFMIVVIFATIKISGQDDKIVILHTNDLHSKLNGYAPELEYTPKTTGDDMTVGGFSRIATLINEEKEKNEHVLVLDAGDFLMGTLFHTLEENTGFQINLMEKMGYDAMAVGNHEFDFGPDFLANTVLNGKKKGDIPELLICNIEFSGKSSKDNMLEELYMNKHIKPYTILEKAGLKIGLIGVIGIDAAGVAPNSRPVEFSKPIKAVKKTAHYLKKKEHVDLVILLSHSGITKGKNNTWQGEDYDIARKVNDVDLIISGHTHTVLNKPLLVNATPVVQTGAYGINIGRTELILKDNMLKEINYELIPVKDNIIGDHTIQEYIQQQQARINDSILHPLGYSYNQVVVESSFELKCDEYANPEGSNLGPFLAEAIYYYVNRHSKEGTDVAMIAAGMIRDNIYTGKTGKQSVADLFKITSLGKGQDKVPGYPLSRVYVNARELKNIIEILLIAHHSSTSNFIYYDGIKIYYNPDKGLLRKVQKIEIRNDTDDYTEIDLSKKNKRLYSIVADSYMLQFVGMIKKMSFGLINVQPKDMYGKTIVNMKTAIIDFDPEQNNIQEGKEWIALLEFVMGFKDINDNGVADIPLKYKHIQNPVFKIKQ